MNRKYTTKFPTFMRKILLIILLAIISVNLAFSQTQDTKSFIKNVDAKTFKALVDSGKGITLDVRTPEEVADGYINGSSTINYYDEDFETKIKLISKEKEIYVYCKGGGRSSEAAKILQKNGFKKVYNLDGGIMGWEGNDYPVVKPDLKKDEKIQHVNLEDFSKILTTNKPILIEFHTVWCAPCRRMAPVMDSLEALYKDSAVIFRIDVDKSKEVAKAYNISGVPVFILFKNGKELWKHSGMISAEELKKQIQSNF